MAELSIDPIADFVEFARSVFVPAVASAFGLPPPPIGCVNVLDKAAMPDGAAAFFSALPIKEDHFLANLLPRGAMATAINVSHHTALMIGAYLTGRSRELPPGERETYLANVKINLLILAHESVHGFKATSREGMLAHDRELNTIPGMRAMMEGLTQVATEIRFDAIVAGLGIEQIDPALAAAGSGGEYIYVGLTDATRTLLDGVSQRSGISPTELALEVVRRDCGLAAVEYLVGACLGSATRPADPAIVAVAAQQVLKRWTEIDTEIDALLATVAVGPGSEAALGKVRALGSKAATEELGRLDGLAAMVGGASSLSVAPPRYEGLG